MTRVRTVSAAIAEELEARIDEALPLLREVEARAASVRSGAGRWSKKEILGHLVDSAMNNLHRFVRASLDGALAFPGYAQDDWVALQGYQDVEWASLIDLWSTSNRHVARVMRRVPDAALSVSCTIGDGAPVTLRFLMEDYIAHLQHHMKQLTSRSA